MQLINEISQLSTAEKILLVERIWEDIETSEVSISFSSEQEKEIKRRQQLYKSGNTTLHTWEEAKHEWKKS
jgi:putative addiction module component (TIGR02574 family)